MVPKGHRLALIVAGTDRGLIDPPSSTPTLTLDLSRTSARVPLLGGADAFADATKGAIATDHAPADTSVLNGVRDPHTAHRIPGAA